MAVMMENIAGEQKIFAMKDNNSFERTYGWAWLLQLQRELLLWDDPLGKKLSSNVAPLARNRSRLYVIANRHLREALPNVASGDYMGEHWLASFAVYALTMQTID
jgi:hypothetical protein